MLNNIYYWLCKIIQIILFMFDKNDHKSCRKIGVENILEKTFSKLEKKYYKECLLYPDLSAPYANTRNSD